MRIRRFIATLAAVSMPLIVVSCGGDDEGGGGPDSLGGVSSDGDVSSDVDASGDAGADAINDATGSSDAGGSLTFDGSEYPVESAVCVLGADSVDVGTVGANYRIFVSGDPADLDLLILDPDGTQWFDGDGVSASSGGKATIDGSTVTGEENTWRNDVDDRVITASFVVECP